MTSPFRTIYDNLNLADDDIRITEAVRLNAMPHSQLEDMHQRIEKNDPRLKSLVILCDEEWGHGGDDVKAWTSIYEPLRYNSTLERLAIKYSFYTPCPIIDSDCDGIVEFLKKNQKIKEISFISAKMSETNLFRTMDVIKTKKTIESLKIGNDILTPDAIIYILKCCSENPSIKSLNIHKCEYYACDSKKNQIILKYLKILLGKQFLQNLSIRLPRDAIGEMVEMLKTNKSLTSLEIETNWSEKFRDSLGAQLFYKNVRKFDIRSVFDVKSTFCELFKINQNIISLKLRNGCVVVNGVKDLLDSQLETKNLIALDLSGLVNDPKSKIIVKNAFKSLELNKTLKNLNLNGAELTDFDAKSLFKALEKNSKLETLSLIDVVFSEENKNLIELFLKKNKSIQNFSIGGPQKAQKPFVEQIINGLKNNKTIKNIELKDFLTTEKFCQEFVKIFKTNNSLISVSLIPKEIKIESKIDRFCNRNKIFETSQKIKSRSFVGHSFGSFCGDTKIVLKNFSFEK